MRVLLALLLLLLVIVSPQLATPTYSSTRVASGGLDVKANVTCYAGISAVDEYIFGEAKILVVYLNPRVLYSYRNVHVVYEDWFITCSSYFDEKYHRRVYIEHPRYGGYTLWLVDLLPRSLFNERLGALKEAFATLNLTVDYLEYVDMNSLFPEPIDPFGQGLILIDLEGMPINLVAKAVGVVFKDVNYTIVVYDKRLYDIYQLLRLDPAASKIIREVRALISEELRPIYRDFVERWFAKEKCISGGGLMAASAGPLAGITGGFYIADIAIPTTYDALSESCKVAILEFIVKVSDIARKYIPEEIPLYISFTENLSPPEPLPLILASGYASGGEPVNTPSGSNFTQLNDKLEI